MNTILTVSFECSQINANKTNMIWIRVSYKMTKYWCDILPILHIDIICFK